MKALKIVGFASVAALVIGFAATPARALELFTNFNDGMELNRRPYGIPDMPAVRFHCGQPGPGETWFQHQREMNWRGRDESAGYPTEGVEQGPAPRGIRFFQSPEQIAPPAVPSAPIRLHAAPMGNERSTGTGEADWKRGESYLPRSVQNQSEKDDDNESDETAE